MEQIPFLCCGVPVFLALLFVWLASSRSNRRISLLAGWTAVAMCSCGVAAFGRVCWQEEVYNAACDGNLPKLRMHLRVMGDPDWDFEGDTPLGCAIENGHGDAVRLLLEAGADPNLPSNTATPLHLARSAGRTDIAKMLITAGAAK